VPSQANGLWAYAQMARWGQLEPSDHRQRAAARVFRPDLYRRGVPVGGLDAPLPLPFDRVAFSAVDVPAYLRRFPLSTSFNSQLTI